MNTVSCIVVEDEPMARNILFEYIQEVKGLNLLGMFENAKDALSFLQEHKVELLFLDVNLPDLSGIDLFRSLSQAPKVIFATAHHEFAVEGFELNAVDYLLKPFSFQRFLKAVNKAFSQINIMGEERISSRISLKSGKTYYSLEQEKILYVEGCGDYAIVKSDDNQVLVHTTLKELEKILFPFGCRRIHRSFIVNLNRVDTVSRKTVSIGEKVLPVGSKYINELSKHLSLNFDENKG